MSAIKLVLRSQGMLRRWLSFPVHVILTIDLFLERKMPSLL